jgi:plastocyanin
MRIKSNLFYKVTSLWWAGAALSGFGAVSSVSVQNDVFVPATSSIHAGDSVVWHWDGDDHNVTSTSSPQDWKATATVSSTTFTFTNTFPSTGSFPYECTIHASIGMLGTINVTAAPTPPIVNITSPASGTLLEAPANVTLAATATDAGGTVTNVEFLVGSTLLKKVATAPFTATTNGLPAGSYVLSAIATASNGLSATNTVSLQVFNPVSLSSGAKLSLNQFQFTYTANIGVSYLVQRSTNLTTWVSMATNTATSSSASFSDSNATNSSAYYRVGVMPAN